MAVRDKRSITRASFTPGSKKLWKLDCDQHRLIFFGLVAGADDEGRLEGDPDDVVALFPRMKLTPETATAALKDLANVGLVWWYKVGGHKYIEIRKFHENQAWHGVSPERSKLPSRPSAVATTNTAVAVHQAQSAATTEGKKLGSVYTSEPPQSAVADSAPTVAPTGDYSGMTPDEAFQKAKRLYRRYVGKSFGSLGPRAREWTSLVVKHGSDIVLSAVESYAQELGKGGRNLNYPLAHFMKNCGEYVDAATQVAEDAKSDAGQLESQEAQQNFINDDIERMRRADEEDRRREEEESRQSENALREMGLIQ